jgi:drug/metabolite transporter (DMT)-like permease
MEIKMILHALFIALVFVAWPIVGKFSGADSKWVGTMVSLGTLLAVASLSKNKLIVPPPINILSFLFILGVANGIGVYDYTAKTSDPLIQPSIFIITTAILMVIIAPLLDWALNGAKFNAYQIAGFGTAIITIYLLSR